MTLRLFDAHCLVTRLLALLDRVGSIGALVAAIAAPCCFPLFAALSAAVGLGTLGCYETTVLYAFQAFAVISLVGLALAIRRYRYFGPLEHGFISVESLAYTFYYSFEPAALYAGLFGLLAATLWNYLSSRWPRTHEEPILRSVITCPHADIRHKSSCLRTCACLFFYDCAACHARLKPALGDCCVFCSYGFCSSTPIQIGAVMLLREFG